MKINGIVAEYNPFHNGHAYQMQHAKEATGADYTIIVMSGNFMQRGAPALLDKFTRAKMALECGADLVLELPICYAASSAEFFAKGSVALFDKLGVTTNLCFGSECGNIDTLSRIAEIFYTEPEPYVESLRCNLKKGMSFPIARTWALLQYAPSLSDDKDVLSSPNNILGIEYLKALKELNSPIVPFTLKREFSGYHDTELHDCSSSASAIRKVLMNIPASPYLPKNISAQLSEQLPPGSLSIIQNEWNFSCPVEADDFSLLLKYRLLSEPHESLCKYQDVSEELSNRIIRNRNQFRSFGQFCTLLKTKELTYSRISRSLLHILLSITTEDMHAYQDNSCSYARILGFRKEHTDVLRAMKDHASIPIITKLGKSASLLSPEASRMLNQTSFASDLYESVISDKFGIPFTSEQQKQIIRV